MGCEDGRWEGRESWELRKMDGGGDIGRPLNLNLGEV